MKSPKAARTLFSLRGFTLIELLVVISIIGILSSVILVNLSAAREKGRIGGGLQFAAYNYHAFGAGAIGIWNFDGTTGSEDTSGNNFDITDTVRLSSNTPLGKGKSLDVANTGTLVVRLPAAKSINGYTLSAWVYLPTITGQNIVSLNDADDGSGNYIGSLGIFTGGAASCTSDFYGGNVNSGTTLGANKWYHVACSYNAATRKTSIYVDGHANGTASCNSGSGCVVPQDTLSVQIGSYISGGSLIDDIEIYPQALADSQIGNIYAAGLPTHFLARNK